MSNRPKQIRHFHCFDDLWEAFDRLAEARDTSVDSLLNEAMLTFLSGGEQATERHARLDEAALVGAGADADADADADAEPAAGDGRSARSTHKRVREVRSTPSPALGEMRLFVRAGAEVIAVEKRRFIIGRDKNADLRLRGGDISRLHAAIVRDDHGYAIVDLGSTNGIYHQDERVQSKRIDEGDVLFLGDHELSFSYRAAEEVARRKR